MPGAQGCCCRCPSAVLAGSTSPCSLTAPLLCCSRGFCRGRVRISRADEFNAALGWEPNAFGEGRAALGGGVPPLSAAEGFVLPSALMPPLTCVGTRNHLCAPPFPPASPSQATPAAELQPGVLPPGERTQHGERFHAHIRGVREREGRGRVPVHGVRLSGDFRSAIFHLGHAGGF